MVAVGVDLPIMIDRAAGASLAVQVADGLRAAAAGGALRPGDRLPSTRALATALGLSRTVTSAAYDQLLAEGWVEGRVGAGTYVTAVPRGVSPAARRGSAGGPVGGRRDPGAAAVGPVPAPTAVAIGPATAGPEGAAGPGAATGPGSFTGSARAWGPAVVAARASAPGRASARRPNAPGRPEPGGGRYRLDPGRPCTAALDRAAWRRAWRAAGGAGPDDVPRPDGLPEFRDAVVEHLLRHRGLTPADVLATAGTSAAVGELARLLPAGATVAVEDPGYQRAVGALRAAGLRVVPVPVDDEGLVVDAIPAGCAAVYTTPAHQFPTAVRLAAPRRVALLERARDEDLLVIEDDYDGELRYDVAPLPLLAALAPDRVVHLGTASKIVSPTLGVGWAVAPRPVLEAWRELRERTGTRPSPAGQRVFAALAAGGDLSRHLRRLRRELRERRELVVAAATRAGWAVQGDPAGAHLVVPLPDEPEAIAAARERGVDVGGLADYATADHSTADHSTADHFTGGREGTGRSVTGGRPAEPAASGLVVGYAAGTRAELHTALALLTGD
ncbi:GntR family transcriptional regulator / MocR family aminotransferase [Pseudonocardia ammonioxydans]|uniref:GntR family transcriptional regulator / MocR family aminotransferase n=1 Tax=Pseudonocardia ammonioxydans TaxID=260086 RepID=A0A1I5F5Q7_PSUAM|nr:PLP-dependent aminotransferase family protein [Pseudonocardia ammonioxydans]SFO19128.1 GntR family transcriptional regulator / MocR family aminotransferase [Pseudonocardia ammonioxydans]